MSTSQNGGGWHVPERNEGRDSTVYHALRCSGRATRAYSFSSPWPPAAALVASTSSTVTLLSLEWRRTLAGWLCGRRICLTTTSSNSRRPLGVAYSIRGPTAANGWGLRREILGVRVPGVRRPLRFCWLR